MANLLTSVRLLLIVPFCWLLLNWRESGWWPIAIMIIAIASDYFDGIVARARNEASSRGMLFDHGTDFLFVTSGLFVAGWLGLSPLILPLLVLIAFSQYVLDSYYWHRQKSLKMSFLGRWNGIFYFVPLLVLSIAALSPNANWSQFLINALHWLGQALIISTLLSIIDRALAPLRPGS